MPPLEIVELRRVAVREPEPSPKEMLCGMMSWSGNFSRSVNLVGAFVPGGRPQRQACSPKGRSGGPPRRCPGGDNEPIGDPPPAPLGTRSQEARGRDALDGLVRMYRWGPAAACIESELDDAGFLAGLLVPLSDCLSSDERNFMRIGLNGAALPEGRLRGPTTSNDGPIIIRTLVVCYLGRDSRINRPVR